MSWRVILGAVLPVLLLAQQAGIVITPGNAQIGPPHGQTPQTQDAKQQPPASIEGRVLNAITGEPLKLATVN